jgi:hypothetical protein
LSKVTGYRPLVFSIVGLIGRRPVAMAISNYSDLNGHLFDPLLLCLRKFESKPKQPEVRVAGDRTTVRNQDVDEPRRMIRENRSPREIEAAMAKANRSANERSSKISRECVTGHLLPTGKAELTPHGIDERAVYLPGFVRRDYARQGISGLNLKVDEKGNPLPPQWRGMTATQIHSPRSFPISPPVALPDATRRTDDTVRGHAADKLLLGHARRRPLPPIAYSQRIEAER